MKRVKANEMWSLMCPDACPGLSDAYGDDFETLYTSYESEKRFVKQVRAQDLWFQVLQNQIETGTPYMLYKDHVNRKNNQSNLGVIKSSNLCTEVVQYSDATTCAVCNLASLVLPTFVVDGKFDFDQFGQVVKTIVKNLNKVIDRNFYPIEQARFSNTRDRPIGIGVQGLADVFAILKLPFESPDARALNRQIFECMYFAALEESNNLAQKHGSYQTFPGSPASKGVLQFDMWGVTPSTTYDWERLRECVKARGLRNSLLIAPMPTASTAQIMGSTEAFEPLTSNLYKRKTLAGEFIVVNKYLVSDLRKLGLWTKEVRQQIIVGDGSIQHIPEIPEELRALYKTVWEVKMRSVIDMAADRGAFVDQSQSMNLFVEAPDYPKLTSMHFYAWEKGLKTGMYYLRSKARAKVQKFTVDPSLSAGNLTPSTAVEDTSHAVCESCSA
jgi:ribonucleoside-diphosphate reductase alpha chain